MVCATGKEVKTSSWVGISSLEDIDIGRMFINVGGNTDMLEFSRDEIYIKRAN
jgi:hypothetical protein